MIFDKLTNLKNYKGMSKDLDASIEWLMQNDYTQIPEGVTTINENVLIKKGTFDARRYANPICEIHHNHFDIHLYGAQPEKIVYNPHTQLENATIISEYNKENDVVFFNEPNKDVEIELTPGTFALFFPNETHCPGINDGVEKVTKYIVKIKS